MITYLIFTAASAGILMVAYAINPQDMALAIGVIVGVVLG